MKMISTIKIISFLAIGFATLTATAYAENKPVSVQGVAASNKNNQ